MAPTAVIWRSRSLERRGRYQEAIDLLTESARRSDDPEVLARLARLRREGFVRAASEGRPDTWPPSHPDRFAGLAGSGPPEIPVDELDAGAIGAGVLHHGSLLVRGLLPPSVAAELLEVFERTVDAAEGRRDARGWYAPVPSADLGVGRRRGWVRHTGGVWIGDAPRALFRIVDAFEASGLVAALTDYFGQRPAFSLEKSTLRLATPAATPEWHQDGAFMGPSLRTVNVWVALTPCGGDAAVPGLDVIPRRFDDFVEVGTRGARLDDFVGPGVIEDLAVECPPVRPRFEPGDALVFDDRSLHATGVDPGMTGDRMAIEFWFFDPATVPERYLPMVL